MAGKNTIRRRKVNHSQELLYEEVVNQRSTRTAGPIPEFLRKKTAEREPKTAEWYRDSLMQLWRFMEERGLVTIGDLDGDYGQLWVKAGSLRGGGCDVSCDPQIYRA